LKSSSSYSAFATLNGEDQNGEKKKCLCGGLHDNKARWGKCEYIAPKNRPSRWKGKKETFEKINKVLKTWDEGKVKWFVDKFGYDGLKESDSKPAEKSDTTKEGDSRKLGSFVSYSSYTSLSQEDYKLYNA
jgi:hypothetical protein